MVTNFWTKIDTNAFLREITGMWLLITGSFRDRPIWRRHFWLQCSKSNSTLARQPNFGQNRLKSRKIGANLSYTSYFTLNPCKLIDSNSTIAHEWKVVKINVKKTLKFNKQCKGSKVTDGKQQKSLWVWIINDICTGALTWQALMTTRKIWCYNNVAL